MTEFLRLFEDSITHYGRLILTQGSRSEELLLLSNQIVGHDLGSGGLVTGEPAY